MGMLMSYMGGGGEGLAYQTLSLVTGALYEQFQEKDIEDFEDFRLAILDLFNTINMALPAKHYDPPSLKKFELFYEEWIEATAGRERKEIFTRFMQQNTHLNKGNEFLVITGVVAPPAAMVVKRTGQNVPGLSVMKAIPHIIFVPSATILALSVVMFCKIKLMKKVASE